jgi:hypothetical protein
MALALEEKIIRELTTPPGNIIAGDWNGPYTSTYEFIYQQASRNLRRVLANNELVVDQPIKELIAWAELLCQRVANPDTLREAFEGLSDVISVHINSACTQDFITDKLRNKHPELVKSVEAEMALRK